MATDKQPRNSAAKKTTQSITRIPTNSKTVSTADFTDGTARNAVIEGSSATDLDDIRKRAYELYEEDGRLDGKHEDHWFRAESEVRGRSAKSNASSEDGNGRQDHQRIA